MLSRKRQLLFSISLFYLFFQAFVVFYGDTNASRYFWLEHKGVKELASFGVPEKSALTPIVNAVSDHHFWILRTALLSTIILAFYYKEKDESKYLLFKNISLSVIILLILASGIITWTLKIFIGKPRPYTKLTHYMPFSLSTRFHSFPSGHTTETFSYIIPYIYFLKKYYIGIILLIYGILASYTRIVLSYHYISDVIFGIFITVISGYLICEFFDKRSNEGLIG